MQPLSYFYKSLEQFEFETLALGHDLPWYFAVTGITQSFTVIIIAIKIHSIKELNTNIYKPIT